MVDKASEAVQKFMEEDLFPSKGAGNFTSWMNFRENILW